MILLFRLRLFPTDEPRFGRNARYVFDSRELARDRTKPMLGLLTAAPSCT